MIRRRPCGRVDSSFAAARIASLSVWISFGIVINDGLPVAPPCVTVGFESRHPPFLLIAHPANGPLLIGTASSRPLAFASASTAGTRFPSAPVKPVHSREPLL